MVACDVRFAGSRLLAPDATEVPTQPVAFFLVAVVVVVWLRAEVVHLTLPVGCCACKLSVCGLLQLVDHVRNPVALSLPLDMSVLMV